MHRHHIAIRQQVVQNREDRFLHLAGIFGPGDQDDFACEVDGNTGLRPGPILLGNRAKFRRVDHRKFRFVRGVVRLANEELAPKKGMPRALRNHPHGQGILRIGPAETVLHEHFFVLEEADDAGV